MPTYSRPLPLTTMLLTLDPTEVPPVSSAAWTGNVSASMARIGLVMPPLPRIRSIRWPSPSPSADGPAGGDAPVPLLTLPVPWPLALAP